MSGPYKLLLYRLHYQSTSVYRHVCCKCVALHQAAGIHGMPVQAKPHMHTARSSAKQAITSQHDDLTLPHAKLCRLAMDFVAPTGRAFTRR